MNWLSNIFGFLRAFQFWIVIAPWENGLRVRVGRSAVELKPGIHPRMPFLDRIFVQPSRMRTISDSGQTVTTKDGKILTLSVTVTYSIKDIKKLYLSVCNPEVTLLNQIQASVAEVVANNDAAGITPKMIESRAVDATKTDEWGLSGISISVTTFAYVRVYRLMNYSERSLSRTNQLEDDTGRVGVPA